MGDDNSKIESSDATINRLRIEEGLDKFKEEKKEYQQTEKDRPQNGQLSRFYEIWSEIVKLPTIGPLQAFSQDIISTTQDLSKITEIMLKLQNDLREYGIQINRAYMKAMGSVYEKRPKEGLEPKELFEEYRKIVIDALEEAFTALFESKDFAVLWNRVFSDQADILKFVQTSVMKNFKIFNLPTREEVDSILKDVRELKRAVYDLKKDHTKRDIQD